MVDARLPDGSPRQRDHPPVVALGTAPDHPQVLRERLGLQDMVTARPLAEESVDFLRRCIQAQLNILISGGTGSGKTTLLNALLLGDSGQRSGS